MPCVRGHFYFSTPTETVTFKMIHKHVLMTHYVKQNQQVHMQMMYIYCIINSVVSDMFRPPIVAVFREAFFEEYIR